MTRAKKENVWDKQLRVVCPIFYGPSVWAERDVAGLDVYVCNIWSPIFGLTVTDLDEPLVSFLDI